MGTLIITNQGTSVLQDPLVPQVLPDLIVVLLGLPVLLEPLVQPEQMVLLEVMELQALRAQLDQKVQLVPQVPIHMYLVLPDPQDLRVHRVLRELIQMLRVPRDQQAPKDLRVLLVQQGLILTCQDQQDQPVLKAHKVI